MMETPRGWDEHVLLEPGGRVIFPETIMAEYVIETTGCELWFNEKDQALGVKLLRGVDDPPYKIERQAGRRGRVRGIIEAGSFLAKVGFSPGPKTETCPCRYFEEYHLLQVRLGQGRERPPLKKEGFLDDFPGLKD